MIKGFKQSFSKAIAIVLSCKCCIACNNVTKIDEEDLRRNVFRENCINCHSFNSNKTEGGITLKVIKELPDDSAKLIYEKAILNEIHSNIEKSKFDTIFNCWVK